MGMVKIPLTGLTETDFCDVPNIIWNYKLSVVY
jgi:hypothetical protein